MQPNIIYRKANLTDVLKLSVLMKQVYIQTYANEGVSDEFANFVSTQFSVENLENIITQEPAAFVVADYNSNLVGAARIIFQKECPIRKIVLPELNKLYVLECFCNKAVGFNLLKAVEKTVEEEGHQELWLWVGIENTRAIKFYERQGYNWLGNAFFQMEVNCYENKVFSKQLLANK